MKSRYALVFLLVLFACNVPHETYDEHHFENGSLWEKSSVNLDSMKALYIKEIQLYGSSSPNSWLLSDPEFSIIKIDSVSYEDEQCISHGSLSFPGRFYGNFLIEGMDRLWVRPSIDTAYEGEGLFLDFSMGKRDSLIIIQKPNFTSTDTLYRLIFEWCRYDSCLNDSVYLFRHDFGKYTYPSHFESDSAYYSYIDDYQSPRDLMIFATPKRGIVGFISGHHWAKKPFQVDAYLGRIYLSHEEIESIGWYNRFGTKQRLNIMSFFDCLRFQ